MSRCAAREARSALFAVVTWSLAAAVAGRAGLWLGIGSVAILLGVVVLVRDRAVRARLAPSWPRILVGLTTAAVMIVATYLLSPVLQSAAPLEYDLQRLYAAFRAAGPGTAVIALGPVVIGEEVVWRGAVQGALERHAGAPAAAVLSAAVYALVHAPIGSPLLVLTALACGTVWGMLRAATGSLVPSIVSHALWDAVVLLACPLVSN
jgi:membrane protease YdiL (CAAX protease family)